MPHLLSFGSRRRWRPAPTAFHRRLLGLAALGLLLAGSPPGLADDDALLAAVHAFLYAQASPLGEEVVVELHPPAARLPVCEQPEPFLPRQDAPTLGRVSVGVRCGHDGRQVRYLQARIGVIGDYPVLTRDVPAGTTLSAAHLTQRRGDLAELPNRSVLDAQALIGQVTTRPLRADRPLQAYQVRERPLVERNQRVSVEARGTAFRVSREGQALDSGALGDEVRVRLGNREVITARVSGEGTLSVDF